MLDVIIEQPLMIVIMSFSNYNSEKIYDWNYVLLTQAFLKLAIYNYE